MNEGIVPIYLCNGYNPGCEKISCYLNGGECRHTADVRYAKDFELKIYQDKKQYWQRDNSRKNPDL